MIEAKTITAFILGFIVCAAAVLYCLRMIGELNEIEMHEKRIV